MLSRRILTLSLLVTAVSAYLYFFKNIGGYVWLLGFGFVTTMCAYVFQHQINWWWYRRYPPAIADEVRHLYLRHAFYAGLDSEKARKFEMRAALFVESREFIAQGIPDVPEDVKFIVAYYAVMVSFFREDYLFEPYKRIVIYSHPFLSPDYPEQIHTYELEHEDGTMIFALEQLNAGFLNPIKYYQTGLHAFAELLTYQSPPPPVISDVVPVWDGIATLTPWTKSTIEDFTGLHQPGVIPSLTHVWFSHGHELKSRYPEWHGLIENWLRA
jgi:hypothetical protein